MEYKSPEISNDKMYLTNMMFIGKFLALKPKAYIYWKILSSEAKACVLYTKCVRVVVASCEMCQGILFTGVSF